MASIGDVLSYSGNAIKNKALEFGQSAVNAAANRAMGYANAQIQRGIDALMDKIPGQLMSLFYTHEDFNTLRLINHQAVHTNFVSEWNFSVSIEGAPSDLDFYVKDISYGFFEANVDEEQYGSMPEAWPMSLNSKRLTMNMRDNEDQRVLQFMINWMCLVFPNWFDGTVGLPLGKQGYVKDVEIFNLNTEGVPNRVLKGAYFPTQVGDISRSRENGAFLEFPITLTMF